MEWSLGLSISSKFPDAADATGLGNHTLGTTASGNERSKRCDETYILERSLWALWRIAWNGTKLGAVR